MAKAAFEMMAKDGRSSFSSSHHLFTEFKKSFVEILFTHDLFDDFKFNSLVWHRLVIHDWERPYYKEGAKSLGYVLEKEVEP